MNKITKEEWLKIRVSEELPLQVFWTYFDDLRPNVATYNRFATSFSEWMVRSSQIPTFNSQKQPVMFSMEAAIKKIFDYFDKKFEI